MNIDMRMKQTEIKLSKLKQKEINDRLKGKYVILANIYSKYNVNKHDFVIAYNYYLNPKRALTAWHKRAQKLIDNGFENVKPLKFYKPYSCHRIKWGMSYNNPVDCNCFLFTKPEAKKFTADSPYPSILFNAIQPAVKAHPNDLFFKHGYHFRQYKHTYRSNERRHSYGFQD